MNALIENLLLNPHKKVANNRKSRLRTKKTVGDGADYFDSSLTDADEVSYSIPTSKLQEAEYSIYGSIEGVDNISSTTKERKTVIAASSVTKKSSSRLRWSRIKEKISNISRMTPDASNASTEASIGSHWGVVRKNLSVIKHVDSEQFVDRAEADDLSHQELDFYSAVSARTSISKLSSSGTYYESNIVSGRGESMTGLGTNSGSVEGRRGEATTGLVANSGSVEGRGGESMTGLVANSGYVRSDVLLGDNRPRQVNDPTDLSNIRFAVSGEVDSPNTQGAADASTSRLSRWDVVRGSVASIARAENSRA